MVKDDDYVTQPNSGTALTYLGEAMEKLGKFDEAAEYHWRTAVAFMKTNPDAAAVARRGGHLPHYIDAAIRTTTKLKEFYVAASGFDGRGVKVGNPEEDPRYWSTVLETALAEPGRRGAAGKGLRLLDAPKWATASPTTTRCASSGATRSWSTKKTATAGWRGWTSSSRPSRPISTGSCNGAATIKDDPKLRSEFFKRSRPSRSSPG